MYSAAAKKKLDAFLNAADLNIDVEAAIWRICHWILS
jgi:hypothetical protein